MWAAPYSFTFHRNYLALGIIPQADHNEDSFDDMFYHEKPSTFVRKQFYNACEEINFEKDIEKFKLVGNMGTDHKTCIIVSVYPRSDDDYFNHPLLQSEVSEQRQQIPTSSSSPAIAAADVTKYDLWKKKTDKSSINALKL